MSSEKVRLLQFVTDFNIGGTERQVLNLALGLDSSRFELHMACFRRQGKLAQELEGQGLPFSEYGIGRLWGPQTFRQQLRFLLYLKRRRIQIVHTYGFYPNVFAIPAAAVARRAVIIASIRDTGVLLTPARKRVQKLACRPADCIVANAEAVRQWLISEGYDPKKITVIQNGIAVSRFVRRNGNGKLHQELGLPSGSPLVAVLSRLNQLKGVQHFLEAARLAAERSPQVRFLILGDGTYRGELERYAALLGLGERVVFTGFRTDVPEVLSEVSVSVLPSFSEGLSNVLLESMAAGVPVVATRVGGNPEVVQDGVTGFLVPPGNPEALAHAIRQVLENPELASRFGCAGKQRVMEQFSLQRMVEKTQRLYVNLLDRCKGRKAGSPRGEQA